MRLALGGRSVGVAVALAALAPTASAVAATTERVSVGHAGQEAESFSALPAISADGQYVAFLSDAPNLVPDDDNNNWDVFLRNRQSGSTIRVSRSLAGGDTNGASRTPAISADGRFVAFFSTATNIVSDDTNGAGDVFVFDRIAGSTSRVSVNSAGDQAHPFGADQPSISASGRYVAFTADATNLVLNDTNGTSDVFVRHRGAGTTERVSVASNGAQANDGSWQHPPEISADGRIVVFTSAATNLVPGDTNGVIDAFTHNRETGDTERVSVATDGTQGDEGSWSRSTSADGRYVSFYSPATNLVAGDTNETYDIFLRDRQDNRTERVSVTNTGNEVPGSSGSASGGPVSDDGRYVALVGSDDLVPGNGNGWLDVFVRDRQNSVNERVSVPDDAVGGHQGIGDSTVADISADGRWVAFASPASNLVPGDTNGQTDIFVHKVEGTPAPTRYVALGYSVAAGEGINYGYRWGGTESAGWVHDPGLEQAWDTTFAPTACHQTVGAHPRVAAGTLSLELTHFACTGATARGGILNAQAGKGIPPQLGFSGPDPGGEFGPPNPGYDAADPQVVSVSVGANDVNFKEVVQSCYITAYQCDGPALRGDIAFALQRQEADLRKVLEELQRRAGPDGVLPQIFFTKYFDPLPRVYPKSDPCRDLKGLGIPMSQAEELIRLSEPEVLFLREQLRLLNANISAVAREYGAQVIDAPGGFAQHPFCRSADGGPWTYGPSIIPADALQQFFESFKDHLGSHQGPLDAAVLAGQEVDFNQAPFHPTPAGQDAIANALEAQIRSTRRTPTGDGVTVPLPSGIRVGFDSVTGVGSTLAVSEGDGASIPAPVSFAKFYAFDLSSSAQHSGGILVQVPYPQAANLYHFEDGSWVKLNSSYNNGYITATVNSLSPFAVGEDAPTVSASFTHIGEGGSPAEVTFDANPSTVSDGDNPAEFEWDFGDGTTGSGIFPTRTYTTSGTYEVRLRVVSEEGSYDEFAEAITITNSAPVAQLSVPGTLGVGEQGPFSSQGSTDSNGEISASLWDFGDGSELEAGADVVHAYSAPGAYTVTLTVLDDEGEPGQASSEIAVSTPPSSPPSSNPPPSSSPPVNWTPSVIPMSPTGLRASATGKCKKKAKKRKAALKKRKRFTKKRKKQVKKQRTKCIKKAKQLPL